MTEDHGAKFATLESGLASLTDRLGSYVSASEKSLAAQELAGKEASRTHAVEMGKIWDELRAQGERFNTALERFGAKGAITWPLVVISASFVLSIVGMAAGLGHFFVETRIRALDVTDKKMAAREERAFQDRQAIHEWQRGTEFQQGRSAAMEDWLRFGRLRVDR